MKKYSIMLMFAVIASSCQDFIQAPSGTVEDNSATTRAAGSDGQDYYWYQGEKIYLTRNNDFVNVIVDGKLKKSSKSELAANSVNASKETAKYVMPFFERGEGIEPIGTSDIFYLKLKSPEDIEMLKKMAAELGVQVIEEIPYTPQWYTLSILGSDFSSSIEACNHFYETGLFEDVDPAFMFGFKPSVDDPEFWRQWGMNNTSYFDYGINVIPAWTITRGAGVKVAVVDSPIQSNHTDLDDNIHSLSYNAQLKRTPSAPYGGDNHGTHVAGIIAAEKNGSMVTGVAYESKIVRVSHDMNATNTSASELASGINWAWKATSEGGAGVDVINCSWGDQAGQVYGQLHSSVLESAISDAMTRGRGGKGCVVVFASGNYGHTNPGRIDYPGNFHSNILVVGGIDSNGNRSYDSSYGAQLDVVAPGGSIWSTIAYNTTGNMGGTSMAAPHVSGIAALILSESPDLTAEEVRAQIESTCTKLPGYSYSNFGYPNGTWNNATGHGLVNAHKALMTRPRSLSIISTGPVATFSSITFRFDNVPAGSGYTLSGTALRKNTNSITPLIREEDETTFTFIPVRPGDYTISATLQTSTGLQYTATKEISVSPADAWIEGPYILGPGETGIYKFVSIYSTPDPVDPRVGSPYPNYPIFNKWDYDASEFEEISRTSTSITLKSLRTAQECDDRETPLKLSIFDVPSVGVPSPIEYPCNITLTAPNIGMFSIELLISTNLGNGMTKYIFNVRTASKNFVWEYALSSSSSTYIPVPSSAPMAIIDVPTGVGFTVRATRTLPCGTFTSYYYKP